MLRLKNKCIFCWWNTGLNAWKSRLRRSGFKKILGEDPQTPAFTMRIALRVRNYWTHSCKNSWIRAWVVYLKAYERISMKLLQMVRYVIVINWYDLDVFWIQYHSEGWFVCLFVRNESENVMNITVWAESSKISATSIGPDRPARETRSLIRVMLFAYHQ